MLGSTRIIVLLPILFFGAVASFNIFSASEAKSILAVPVADDDTIIGGHNASIEDHPHQVFFKFEQNGQRYMCGGFIISENYIVTAAHCLADVDHSTVKLRVGSTWRDNGTLIPIAEVIPHPEYANRDKDVGVMKTAEPIQFTKTVQPIKLSTKGRSIEDGSMVTVTGWGSTKEGGASSEHLLAVEVPVVNFEKCNTSYKDLTENMWCAGYFESGGKDSCGGDSGGPAVQDGIAVGIVSFGAGCARPKNPGVYANISAPAIRDFITQHTGL